MANVTPLHASKERTGDKLDRVEQQLETVNKSRSGIEGRMDVVVGTTTRVAESANSVVDTIAQMEKRRQELEDELVRALESPEGSLKDTAETRKVVLAVLRRL